MAFTKEELRNIESTLLLWLATNRPEEEIRDKVDFGYTIKGREIFLEEIQPIWNHPSEKMRNAFTKVKFEKTNQAWKIYWMRGNLKWNLYDPKPSVESLDFALDEIMRDPHHCFFG